MNVHVAPKLEGNMSMGTCLCYHHGAVVLLLWFQDCHGRLCVICPWHKHSITLDTGESLYTAVDPSNLTNVTHNMSKGVKQVINIQPHIMIP